MGVSANPGLSFLLRAKLEGGGITTHLKNAIKNQAALADDFAEETRTAHSPQCLLNSAFPSSQVWT